LKDVVRFVQHLSPLSHISLIGFSLGANIMLKAIGEWAADNPAKVDAAIAIAPPIDLTECSANLRKYGNRIYDYFFVKRLRDALAFRRRRVANLVDNGLNPLPDRLVHFDDQFVAPLCGFSGARDYYEKCSAGPLLGQIAIPTIIVAARDDPVIPYAMFADWTMSGTIEMVATKNGGHLGFFGNHPGDPDRHWLDWRICRWINRLDH
jgi:predicted alpha/beta-fold hydrolase